MKRLKFNKLLIIDIYIYINIYDCKINIYKTNIKQ